MAYGNNKTKFKELDKNTYSFRLKNATATFPSTMALGFWNSTLTLKIHPALPEGQRSTEKYWDYNIYSMAVLNSEKAIILLSVIEENMKEIMSGDFDPFGVTSGAAYVEVSPFPGMEGIDDNGLFINIYNKIDSEGVPGEIISYKFNTNNYYKNFKVSGKTMSKCTTNVPSEFLLFLTYLKEGIKGIAGGIAHGIRNANKNEYSRSVNDRHRIMEKLGLTSNDFRGSSFGTNSSSSFFQENSGSASQSSNGEFDYSVDYSSLGGNTRVDIQD